MTLILPRRRFLAGLVGLVAAPAVVKASSLMKIVAPRPDFAIVDFSDAYGRSPMMDALPDMIRWQYAVETSNDGVNWLMERIVAPPFEWASRNAAKFVRVAIAVPAFNQDSAPT